MRIEERLRALAEHELNIKRCIENGIIENQRNIAFNISQASIELFSIYLVKQNLITSSVDFDHRIFKKSIEISKKIPFNFPNKSMILELMRKIEEKRLFLCYGKRKPEKDVKDIIKFWNEIKPLLGEDYEKK